MQISNIRNTEFVYYDDRRTLRNTVMKFEHRIYFYMTDLIRTYVMQFKHKLVVD
ncbi:unnamed protein product [Nezara viridula]|uniref:Uncharacterized protein n=1 Tax=Nezara viridula TaxID=85310 RepID=A0A9P0HPL3_NEZVI|nr:unnamed protein product [Nezara viridula]